MTALLILTVLLAGCGTIDGFRRPDGDGGWSAAERHRRLGEIAAGAGVAWEAAPSPPPAPATIDLPAALALAAAHNRRIAAARQQLAMAAERVYDVRGRLLPATVGSGRYTWYSDPLRNAVALPPGFGDPNAAPFSIEIREQDFGTLNGTLQLPLDLSGELRHALAAAQAGYRGERARVWATTLAQQLAVTRSYFQYLEAVRLRDVAEQTAALYRAQLGDAQKRFAAGRATKNDVLVVQVALRNAEQRLVRRAIAIDDARRALNQAIGAEVDAPLALADVTRPPELPSAEEALGVAFERNPSLQALLEERQRLEESLTALERSRFPRPYAGGAVDYSSSEILQPQSFVSGFVGFSWDLGTDTRREAQIAEARLATEHNRTVLQEQMRELEAAVRSTQQAAGERLTALATAAVAVGQAEENLRIRRQQFDAGRAQSTDVLDAERLLAAQRADLATALYQAHIRRAELQQLVGLPLDETAEPR